MGQIAEKTHEGGRKATTDPADLPGLQRDAVANPIIIGITITIIFASNVIYLKTNKSQIYGSGPRLPKLTGLNIICGTPTTYTRSSIVISSDSARHRMHSPDSIFGP